MNLKCKHQLCTTCYYNWTDDQGKNTCPCCRNNLYTKAIDERLIELRNLNFRIQGLENKKYDMQLTVDVLREDRDHLIHESVEYNKKVKLIKERKRELEDELYCIEYDIRDKKKYAGKINLHLLPKNKTTDSFELAKHFRGVAKKFDKQYDNETKEGYTTVVKSFNHISKKNNKDIKKILKKSVKGKRKNVYVSEEEDEDMCIYELFKDEVEEYNDVEDETLSDTDSMPELEEREIYETDNMRDIDRYIIRTMVNGDISLHTPYTSSFSRHIPDSYENIMENL